MADHSQQIQELFAQIGSRLRAAREAHGYTLQELSAHTRINLLFLQKIEAGDLNGMPGLAFVKGFIRNYMQVLQINDADLEDELRRLLPATGPASSAHIRPTNPYVLESEPAGVPYWRIGLFVGLAVLILWVGYTVFRGSTDSTADAPAQQTVTPPGEPQATTGQGPAPLPGSPATDVPASAASERPTGAPPAATPPPGAATAGPTAGAPARGAAPLEARQTLELTLRGIEPTWVRLTVDRAPPVDVRLQPAETVSWEATQEIRLTIGKSQGVAVYLNGEEILLPAEPNRIIPNLVLNRLTLLRLEN